MNVIIRDIAVQTKRIARSIRLSLAPNPLGVHSLYRAPILKRPNRQNVKRIGPKTTYIYSAIIAINFSKTGDISSHMINPMVNIKVTTAELIEYPVKMILILICGLKH